MNRKTLIQCAAAAGALAIASAVADVRLGGGEPFDVPPAQHEPYASQKVVYNVTQGGGWFGRDHAARLHSMLNHVNAVGRDKLEMGAVLQGDGASLLHDATSNAKIRDMVDRLRGSGVRFVICRNTMVGKHYPLSELYNAQPNDIVPAGVAEVVALQQMGYLLVKL